ncbi:hypothetical protein F3A59_23785, partial [Salmonella enterica subsp. enterica serovar Typhi]|nr:hypothetical protein [Salmonella enterica subsp. enterica serovar Typhi]
MNNIDENTLSKLMECMDKKCTLADLSDSIPSVINCMKTFKGGKALCALMKAFVPEGPMATVVNQLSEEDMIKMINCLAPHEINVLMKMGSGPPDFGKLFPIGLKILPILKKANGGKGLGNIISIFMGGGGGGNKNG